ncbi:MAG: benzoate/H(+) symporter BenE family transporter [Deltaproteobacteria bacterium]|nr:benzoate/H(+) symporter BenE family transporter [Deltaproteobacteria bacterium]MBI2180367.1 benzoate/H(+) symporter BenE family transporter [Deltaproteobacteria bacterium]MBI2229348.1 benzoate/H(+) symporter BenE family transporter [Deltaproteobacteria bacterium]
MIETGSGIGPAIRDLPKSLTLSALTYGVTAWLFAVTGPFLIYVNAARQGNLSALELNSWIFGGYFICGLLSVALSLYYRLPLLAAITIPGGVLVAAALTHLSFAEIIGAYLVTGVLITALGVTGAVKRGMEWLPMPITMAMVAGILLQFGMGIITSLQQTPLVSGVTLTAYLLVSLVKPLARRFPPVLGAIIVGLMAAAALGQANWRLLTFGIAEFKFFTPQFTWPAAVELVIPLALTVIAVQNAQGIAILQNMGYRPPLGAVTITSGVGSILVAPFGSQSVCLAGPMTGIVTNPSVGPKECRYAAALVTGILWMVFGLFSPMATALSRILPTSLVDLLAGLALLEVLGSCFAAAFGEKFRLGALFTFLITISGMRLLNIGAPFWGLVGGTFVSALLERQDFRNRRSNR